MSSSCVWICRSGSAGFARDSAPGSGDLLLSSAMVCEGCREKKWSRGVFYTSRSEMSLYHILSLLNLRKTIYQLYILKNLLNKYEDMNKKDQRYL